MTCFYLSLASVNKFGGARADKNFSFAVNQFFGQASQILKRLKALSLKSRLLNSLRKYVEQIVKE